MAVIRLCRPIRPLFALSLKIDRTGCPQNRSDGSGRWLIPANPIVYIEHAGQRVSPLTLSPLAIAPLSPRWLAHKVCWRGLSFHFSRCSIRPDRHWLSNLDNQTWLCQPGPRRSCLHNPVLARALFLRCYTAAMNIQINFPTGSDALLILGSLVVFAGLAYLVWWNDHRRNK